MKVQKVGKVLLSFGSLFLPEKKKTSLPCTAILNACTVGFVCIMLKDGAEKMLEIRCRFYG